MYSRRVFPPCTTISLYSFLDGVNSLSYTKNILKINYVGTAKIVCYTLYVYTYFQFVMSKLLIFCSTLADQRQYVSTEIICTDRFDYILLGGLFKRAF